MKRRKVSNFDFLSRYDHFVPGAADIVILLLLLLAGTFAGSLLSGVFVAATGGAAGMEAAMIISYPVMFIPPMIYASSRSRRNHMSERGVKLDSPNFGRLGIWLCGLLAVLGTLALGYCAEPLVSLLPPMPAWLESALTSMTRGNLWIDFICVSIMAPVFEEWLCRGMVLRGLLNKGVKPVWAVTLSALFFAFIHLNPWQALPAFLLGCLFGYVYYRTGSLKLTILMHFANNTFSLALSQIDALKDVDGWAEVLAPGTYWALFAALAAMVVLVVRAFLRIPLTSPKGNCDAVPSMFDE